MTPNEPPVPKEGKEEMTQVSKVAVSKLEHRSTTNTSPSEVLICTTTTIYTTINRETLVSKKETTKEAKDEISESSVPVDASISELMRLAIMTPIPDEMEEEEVPYEASASSTWEHELHSANVVATDVVHLETALKEEKKEEPHQVPKPIVSLDFCSKVGRLLGDEPVRQSRSIVVHGNARQLNMFEEIKISEIEPHAVSPDVERLSEMNFLALQHIARFVGVDHVPTVKTLAAHHENNQDLPITINKKEFYKALEVAMHETEEAKDDDGTTNTETIAASEEGDMEWRNVLETMMALVQGKGEGLIDDEFCKVLEDSVEETYGEFKSVEDTPVPVEQVARDVDLSSSSSTKDIQGRSSVYTDIKKEFHEITASLEDDRQQTASLLKAWLEASSNKRSCQSSSSKEGATCRDLSLYQPLTSDSNGNGVNDTMTDSSISILQMMASLFNEDVDEISTSLEDDRQRVKALFTLALHKMLVFLLRVMETSTEMCTSMSAHHSALEGLANDEENHELALLESTCQEFLKTKVDTESLEHGRDIVRYSPVIQETNGVTAIDDIAPTPHPAYTRALQASIPHEKSLKTNVDTESLEHGMDVAPTPDKPEITGITPCNGNIPTPQPDSFSEVKTSLREEYENIKRSFHDVISSSLSSMENDAGEIAASLKDDCQQLESLFRDLLALLFGFIETWMATSTVKSIESEQLVGSTNGSSMLQGSKHASSSNAVDELALIQQMFESFCDEDFNDIGASLEEDYRTIKSLFTESTELDDTSVDEIMASRESFEGEDICVDDIDAFRKHIELEDMAIDCDCNEQALAPTDALDNKAVAKGDDYYGDLASLSSPNSETGIYDAVLDDAQNNEYSEQTYMPAAAPDVKAVNSGVDCDEDSTSLRKEFYCKSDGSSSILGIEASCSFLDNAQNNECSEHLDMAVTRRDDYDKDSANMKDVDSTIKSNVNSSTSEMGTCRFIVNNAKETKASMVTDTSQATKALQLLKRSTRKAPPPRPEARPRKLSLKMRKRPVFDKTLKVDTRGVTTDCDTTVASSIDNGISDDSSIDSFEVDATCFLGNMFDSMLNSILGPCQLSDESSLSSKDSNEPRPKDVPSLRGKVTKNSKWKARPKKGGRFYATKNSIVDDGSITSNESEEEVPTKRRTRSGRKKRAVRFVSTRPQERCPS